MTWLVRPHSCSTTCGQEVGSAADPAVASASLQQLCHSTTLSNECVLCVELVSRQALYFYKQMLSLLCESGGQDWGTVWFDSILKCYCADHKCSPVDSNRTDLKRLLGNYDVSYCTSEIAMSFTQDSKFVLIVFGFTDPNVFKNLNLSNHRSYKVLKFLCLFKFNLLIILRSSKWTG